MARGPNIGLERLRHRESNSMTDLAGENLVIAKQPCENRQPRRIGRSPCRRPQIVREQVENRARIGFPARRLRKRSIQLVQNAVVDIHRNGVPVARTVRTAFDRGIQRHCVRPRIALARPLKCGRVLQLRRWNGNERNPDRPAVPHPRPKVRVYAPGRPNRGDVRRRTWRNGQLIDRRVPDIVRWEHWARSDHWLSGEPSSEKNANR
jgi:hypothetical protein